MPIYLDCNATTPMEPEVLREVMRYMSEEYGNAGSRTHEFGNRAKKAVQAARDQVAAVVGAQREEVVFTSGATESNNLAILGLAEEGRRAGRRHIISSPMEHKAVLEPLEALARQGFKVELLPADERGWIPAERLAAALRPDTLLVSLMHVNNETGIRQPLEDYSDVLRSHEAYWHVDAAQGFGKDIEGLRSARIDLISLSGHKIYAPKGIGALVARRRGYEAPPLRPLAYGGGQERGLRPGTIPVPLAVGLGKAADLALRSAAKRAEVCRQHRVAMLEAFSSLDFVLNGDQDACLPHVTSISFPGIDSEAFMVAMKQQIAVSNGSACTSHDYTPSHVLAAMGLDERRIGETVRISWCHLTESVEWGAVAQAVAHLL